MSTKAVTKPKPLELNFVCLNFKAIASPNSHRSATERNFTPSQRRLSASKVAILTSSNSPVKTETKFSIFEEKDPFNRPELLNINISHRRNCLLSTQKTEATEIFTHNTSQKHSKTHFSPQFLSSLFKNKDNDKLLQKKKKSSPKCEPTFVQRNPKKRNKFTLPELLISRAKPVSTTPRGLSAPLVASKKSTVSKDSLLKDMKHSFPLRLPVSRIGRSNPVLFSEREILSRSPLNITGTSPPKRKNTHSPARFIEIKQPINQRYSAENLNAYEKTGGLLAIEDQQLNRVDQEDLNILESYRKKLNEQFVDKFRNNTERIIDIEDDLCGHVDKNFDEAKEPSLEMIPSLEILDYLGRNASRRAHFQQSELGDSGALRTRKTLNLITKLDNLQKSEKFRRYDASGLPSQAKVMKMSLTNLGPAGAMLRKKTVVIQASKNQTDNKKPSEHQSQNEDNNINGVLSHELLTTALPINIVSQKHLFQVPVNTNTRWSKNPVPIYKRLRKRLLQVLQELKLLKLNPKLLMNTKIFSKDPYGKPKSWDLIQACKEGNNDLVTDLLHENRFLVYDFDQYHLTALHWAIRKGFFIISRQLIEKGADVNAKDLIGRTPLSFAIHANRVDLVKLLLSARCDPWSSEDINYTEMVKNKRKIKLMLRKSRQIHIIMKMTPPQMRDLIWEKQTLDWMLNLDPKNEADIREYDIDIDETLQSSQYDS